MTALTEEIQIKPSNPLGNTATKLASDSLPVVAAAASLTQAPATLSAVTAAFGLIAPEIVLPLVALIMACSAVGSYLVTEAAVNLKMDGRVNLVPDKTPPLIEPSKVVGQNLSK